MRLRRLVVVGLLLGLLGVLLPVSPVGGQVSSRVVSGVSVSGDGEGVAVVSWVAPVEAPVDYRVMWARADLEFLSYRYEDEAERGNSYPAGSAVSVRLEGLTPGAQYKATVRARYGPGRQGPWSDHASGPAGQPDDSTENDDDSSENDGDDDGDDQNDDSDDDGEDGGEDGDGDGDDGDDQDDGDDGDSQDDGGSGPVDGGITHGDGDGFDLVGVMSVASAWVGDQEVLGYSLRGGGVGSFATTSVGDEQYAGHVGGRGFLNGLMRVPGRYDISRVGEYDDALVLMTQFGLAAPFLLEVGGRLYSSASASALNVRGYSDKFWVWEDPCARWAEGEEVAVSFDDGAVSAAALRSADASLASLGLAGAVLGQEFSAAVLDYSAAAGDGVSRITVDAAAADENACSVEVSPADADPDAAGHQVDVDAEDGAAVAVAVTAGDGATAAVYTVTVSGSSGALPAAAAAMGLDGIPGLGFDPQKGRYDKVVPPGTTSTTVRVRTAPGTAVDTTAYRAPAAPAPVAPRAPKSSLVRSSAPEGRLLAAAATKSGGGSAGGGGGPEQEEVGSGGRVELPPGRDTVVVVKTSTEDYERERIYTARLRPAPAGRTRSTMTAGPVLSGLSVVPGELSPAFDSATRHYAVAVAHSTEQVTIAATAAAGTVATVTAPDADTASGHQVALNASADNGSTQTAVLITATRGTEIDTYTVTITRAARPDVSLRSLSVSNGTLSPAFDPGTAAYAVSTGYEVVTVRAAAGDDAASVSVSPADVRPGTAGHQVYLAPGDNTVTVEVTAADGVTTQSYTVTATRVVPANDVSLRALSVSPGALSPALGPDTVLYGADFGQSVKTVTLSAVASHDRAALLVGPADADPVAAGHQVKLRSGDNPVTVRVVAADGSRSRTYVVTLTRAAPAASAAPTLRALSVDVGTAIVFDSDTEWYWVSDVGSQPTTATVAWAATDAAAAVTVTPADADPDTDGHQVAIGAGGGAEVKLLVEAADGASTRTYTVALHRTVKWVKIDSGYDHWCALRSNGQAVCWGRQVASGEDSRVKWAPIGDVYRDVYAGRGHSCGTRTDGSFHCWSNYSRHYPEPRGVESSLDPGEAGIITFDTADATSMCWVSERGRVDCAHPTEWLPTVVRAGRQQMASSAYHLTCAIDIVGGLVCWDSRKVLNTPSGLYKFVTVGSRTACGIRLDGSMACWSYKDACSRRCNSTFTRSYTVRIDDTTRVYVHADDHYNAPECGITADGDLRCTNGFVVEGDYTMVASRFWSPACAIKSSGGIDCWSLGYKQPRPNYRPPDISADPGAREILIDGAVVRWSGTAVDTVVVPSAQTTADIEVFPSAASAGVAFSAADADTAAPGHQLALTTGDNTFTFTITSEDGNAERTYTATITRRDMRVELSSLSLSAGALAPAFDEGVLAYDASVGKDVAQITVAAVASATGASVSITPGDADTATPGHQVDLAVGDNAISVEVTAPNSTDTETYTVTVNRLDVTLRSLSISNGTLSPAFDPATTAYTVSTGYEVVTVRAAASDAATSVSISPGDVRPGTAGHQVYLAPGDNTVTVVVTGADGVSTQTYTVTATRVVPVNDVSLRALSVSPGALSPALGPDTLLYQADFGQSVKTVTLSAAASHDGARVLIGPADADPVAAGHQIKLRSGENPVTIRVVAANGSNSRTRVVTLTRAAPAAPAAPTLSALSVDVGTPIAFDSDTEWYWVSDIGSQPTTATFAWTPTDAAAAVTVTPADADPDTDGHQIAISTGGGTEVKLLVEAADGATTRTYTVALHRTVKWVKIDSGYDHWCALRSNGQAVCWGSQVYSGEDRGVKWAPPGNVYRDIYAGRGHSCGTRTDGSFHCWTRYNRHNPEARGVESSLDAGEAGILTFDTTDATSMCWVSEHGRVGCAHPTEWLPPVVRAGRQQMVSSLYHLTCALDIVGGVACWDSRKSLHTPSGQFEFITAGLRSACGIRPDGSMLCWRYQESCTYRCGYAIMNRSYTVGWEDSTRVYVHADDHYNAPACGITADGDLRCSNGYVVEGDYTMVASRFWSPACAIKSSGGIDCWSLGFKEPRPKYGPPDISADPGVREILVDGAAARWSGTAVDTVVVSAAQTTADIEVFPRGESAGVAFSATDADSTAPGHQLALTTGTNTFTFTVTSEDGTDTRTYTGTIIRPAIPNLGAELSGLTLSTGTLTPSFNQGIFAYTAAVGKNVAETTVAAAAKFAGATVSITPGDADTATPGHQIYLAAGDTAITVQVTAPHSTDTETYTITVNRPEP